MGVKTIRDQTAGVVRDRRHRVRSYALAQQSNLTAQTPLKSADRGLSIDPMNATSDQGSYRRAAPWSYNAKLKKCGWAVVGSPRSRADLYGTLRISTYPLRRIGPPKGGLLCLPPLFWTSYLAAVAIDDESRRS